MDKADEVMWWGYLHSNGQRILKRWYGDTKDYQDDCYGNPFVVKVVRPFKAKTTAHASEILSKAITKQLEQDNDESSRVEA